MMALSMETPDPIDPIASEKARRKAEANQRRLRRYKFMFPILVVFVFLAWGFTTNYIPSQSMEPTLRPGDHILTMRTWLAYLGGRIPARGDIVVFVVPNPEDQGTPRTEPQQRLAAGSLRRVRGDILIKRVAGLPGETIQVQDSRVWINGREIPRETIGPVKSRGFIGPTPWAYVTPIRLRENEIFVLGDNPGNSDDSRFWGPLNRDRIVGRYVRLLFHERDDGPNRKYDSKSQNDNNGESDNTGGDGSTQ